MDNAVDHNSSQTSIRVGVALLLAGAVFRIVSFYFSSNTGGDAGARVGLTAVWLQHPTLKFVFDVYPPGHFWLIAFSTLLVHDVVTAGRLLSLVLGIGSLILVWKIARLLYDSWSGLLSLCVFSLYSLHIAYSTTSSAEVVYLFFFLAGAYFFFRYLRGERNALWQLAASGTLLSIAESVRYEAWFLFGGLFLILAISLRAGADRVSWGDWLRALVVFGATGGLWPVFIMAYSWHSYGDPLHLVKINGSRINVVLAANSITKSQLIKRDHYHQLTLMPVALLLGLSPLAMAGALYGLAKSFSKRLTAAFAVLILFFAVVQAYWICTGSLLATARYTLTLGTMLAIVSGYGLQKICERVFPNRGNVLHALLFVLLAGNLMAVFALSEVPNRYSEKIASVSPRLRYPQRIRLVGDYLRNHLRAGDSIIIDDYNVESNIIAEAAGLPVISGNRAYLVSKKNPVSVDEYIRAQHPRFLVYAAGGTLQHSFRLSPACDGTQETDGIELHCAFTSPIYRIYELSYRDTVGSRDATADHK